MSVLHNISLLVVLIGALNWGIVGVTSWAGNKFDLIGWITVDILNNPILNWVVYIVIAVAAFLVLATSRE